MKVEINWTATHNKWKTAIATFSLNVSELAREAKVTRQHVVSIMAGNSVPSVLVAERIDKAVDEAVERRKAIARSVIRELEESGQ